jgi:hypothetical protein
MGTHYSNWQFEMGILYGLSADTRAGAILFCADHLVLKRHALRVPLGGVDVDPDRHPTILDNGPSAD